LSNPPSSSTAPYTGYLSIAFVVAKVLTGNWRGDGHNGAVYYLPAYFTGGGMSQLHVNQIRGFLTRTFRSLIDLKDVQNLQEHDREAVFLTRALAAFAVAHLAGLDPAEAAEAVTDGAGDNGVDALHYNRNSRTLYVVQSKWFGSGHGSFDVADTGKLVQGFRDLVNQRLDRFTARFSVHLGTIGVM
jgi:hypothetical protein